MSKKLLFRLTVLVTAVVCALGASAQEAYAVYTPENTTFTFYYDNERSSRPGATYDLNTGHNDTSWGIDGTNHKVTRVVFDPSFAGARPTSTFSWFYNMERLQSIEGFEYLNTSEVTIMGFMFRTCLALTSLDLSSFNTSNVTDMTDMFFGCINLNTVYVGKNWSTEAVTNSSDMFYNVISLVGGMGTVYNESNPMDKTYAHIDGGPSNPGYFTLIPEPYACYTPSNMTLTFYYDNQRSTRPGTTYDLNTSFARPGWRIDDISRDVTKVVFDPSFASVRPTSTYYWFGGMLNLEAIEGMKYLNTSEVTDMNCMFAYCEILTSLDLSSFNTANVTDMYYMFSNCHGLKSLDLGSFNTAKVENMASMFGDCDHLQTIYVSDEWSTASLLLLNPSGTFTGCTSLVGGQGTAYDPAHTGADYAHIDGGPDNPGYLTDPYAPKAYVVFTAEDETLTFYYDHLRGTRSGKTYNLNTGRNNPDWYDDQTCMQVKYAVIDPSFADARPTTTYSWFLDMELLESITGLEYLNTSEVTNMEYMFAACNELTSLDLSHFNTEEVTFMGGMFIHCNKIKSLDLSSFNTAKVRGMRNLFALCHALQTIYVGNGWSTASVSDDFQMFMECNSLVGGKGTTFDPAHIRSEYAHIDGGPDNPGYFTDKNAVPRGDVNCDGSVNISDVTVLIDLLLGGGTISNPVADCNQDGSINISDVTVLIDYLLSNHW